MVAKKEIRTLAAFAKCNVWNKKIRGKLLFTVSTFLQMNIDKTEPPG